MILFCIYFFFSPIIWSLIQVVGLFHRKIRRRLLSQGVIWRRAVETIDAKRGDKSVIILHAASAGEFEQLKPLLPKIDRSRFLIVQVFFSPTVFGKEYTSDIFDAVCYHPVDTPLAAFHFFKRIRPKYYIITRHDIWPNHIFFARLFKIKTILINANMHKKSLRMHFLLKGINQWLFNQFDLILCGSKRLQSNLSLLVKSPDIVVTGDTRFEQVQMRKERNPGNHFPVDMEHTRNIILGSIISSDFGVLMKGLQTAYPVDSLRRKNIRCIIVPHEVDNRILTNLEHLLQQSGLKSVRYSTMESLSGIDAVIVDRVGILAELYAYAELAYVGAGFGSGVHNVLEPAVYGCAISFGPNYHILDEAISLAEQDIATVIRNSRDFTQFCTLFEKPGCLRKIRERTRNFAESHKNASENIINEIFS